MHEGAKRLSVWGQLRGQIYLGPKAFVKKMQALVDKKPPLSEVPRAQRRALSDTPNAYERNDANASACVSGRNTMAVIAKHIGVHYTTVSRLVNAHETPRR